MAAYERKQKRSDLEKRQLQNKAVAIIVPLILIGIVAYASWVIVALIASKQELSAPATCSAPSFIGMY